ncbi:hypothetical protein [Vagococcus sp. WN89Y]|uniref:hypothetical protein n=1 Tax=Vagococcus sp. WN89Y TaxID=3457258 RepID=UPI003FCDB3D0
MKFVTKLLLSIKIEHILCTIDSVIRMGKVKAMLTAMKNVIKSYFLSLAEVHPEVTRF